MNVIEHISLNTANDLNLLDNLSWKIKRDKIINEDLHPINSSCDLVVGSNNCSDIESFENFLEKSVPIKREIKRTFWTNLIFKALQVIFKSKVYKESDYSSHSKELSIYPTHKRTKIKIGKFYIYELEIGVEVLISSKAAYGKIPDKNLNSKGTNYVFESFSKGNFFIEKELGKYGN